ncbi:MAG: O-antigen ligase family protein [Candidatus Omnitrophota bacterium]|nr:O-antigen ligase family protein [Candidatus Omnitrophota bacterium]
MMALRIPQYPKIILTVLFFAAISFLPQTAHDRYGLYIRLFLGCFVFFLACRREYRAQLFSPQDWPLWLFLASFAAGIINAADRSLSLRTYFPILITFASTFYIGKSVFLLPQDRVVMKRLICICATVVAIIGLLELYYRKNIIYEKFLENYFYARYISGQPRPMSTQGNPAVLGTYLLCCLPFCLDLAKNRKLYLKILGAFAFLICLAVMILTFSRGVFVAFAAMGIFYLWQSGRKKLLLVFFGMLVVFIAFNSFQKAGNLKRFSFHGLISGSGDSMFSDYRLNRINMSLKMLRDYPLCGIGLNHFRLRFKEYCLPNEKKILYEFMIPDNMYLTFLAETGIIGLSGFLVFIITIFVRGLKKYNKLGESEEKASLLVALAALVGILVNMGAYELFYWADPLMLFSLLCGSLSAKTFLLKGATA